MDTNRWFVSIFSMSMRACVCVFFYKPKISPKSRKTSYRIQQSIPLKAVHSPCWRTRTEIVMTSINRVLNQRTAWGAIFQFFARANLRQRGRNNSATTQSGTHAGIGVLTKPPVGPRILAPLRHIVPLAYWSLLALHFRMKSYWYMCRLKRWSTKLP